MVIHACVLSQALFSTELHWRTKIVRFGDHVGALVLQLADLRRLSLGHTWLYSALTRYDSSSALFDATPACPHTLSGPVLHTYVSDSSTQSPDALFSIVLKPPAGVFSTTDRRFFDHRPATGPATAGYHRLPPATDRLPTGYRRLSSAAAGYRPATDRLPPATDRLPTGYRRLPTGYRRLPPATDRLPPATDRRLPTYRRLPTGYRRLPTGYRRLPTGYRRLPPATDRLPPATDRLPPATDRLPTGYRPATDRLPPATNRLPPATDRLPPVQKKKKKKKKKKKIFFLTPEECHSCSLQTEFPIWRLGDANRAQKFSGHVLQIEDCMCVSLYIYGH